jgi:RIO kinase 1
MNDPLAPLLADGIIDEVLSRLKSGKEADIFLVSRGAEVLAAKVYKDRSMRSFQNNAVYREGRTTRNSRTQRAIEKGSRFGRDAAEDAWKTKEAEALETLFAAGVRVPKPHLFYEGVLLMEAVSDSEGRPAPRLIDASIPVERAGELYADLRQQAIRILACDLIHGDLSPYNVLLAWNGPTVIDLPQVVGAAHNSQAELFFRRDLEAIRRFFAALDPALDVRAGDAAQIWQAYVRRELRPDFVPSVRVEPAGRGQRPSLGQGQTDRPGGQGGPLPGGGRQRRRRRGGPQPAQTSPPGPARTGSQPVGQPRTGAGPMVSYVGRPAAPIGGPGPAASSTPLPAGGGARRRRRRRRRGGGPPPQS